MDYPQHMDHQKSLKSHVEYNVSQIDNALRTKQISFQSMDLLEGWCSKEKAAILIDLIYLLQPETIVEIGVFGGKSLIPMAYAVRDKGKGKVYGIDPWSAAASTVGMDGVNKEWWGHVNHDAILTGLRKKIKQFALENQIVLIRNTSADAAPIPNIDLLHVDGNHSEETSVIDINKWVPLVRKGGIIVFDDVNWATTKTAQMLLDKQATKIAEYKGDNIWGIWIKN